MVSDPDQRSDPNTFFQVKKGNKLDKNIAWLNMGIFQLYKYLSGKPQKNFLH